MQTPRPRGSRRVTLALLALVLVVSGLSSAFLPSTNRLALAKDGTALGDALILAGPGGDYGILTVAPSGSVMSVDGEPVDGYYPVTFEGVSGWTATGLVEVGNTGGGDGGGDGGDGNRNRDEGNGGVETVVADPVYTDGSAPAEPEASEPVAEPAAEPVTGGAYGPGGASYSEEQIVEIITEAADNYGQSSEDMLRVARCESGLDPYAVGGGGAYHGLFQFVPVAFSGTPYGEYDIYDAWANANAAGWMWSEGRKNDWVCQ